MKLFSIVSVSIINFLITIYYCILIKKNKIKPVLAMWVFFAIAVGGSLFTYLKSGNFTLLDNILNTSDIFLVMPIIFFIVVYSDKSSRFTVFDTFCLGAVLLILLFWTFTKNHVVSHSLIQLILIIAYIPVFKRLWKAKKNTESFLPWVGMLITPILSLLSSKGLLATIYSLRAIISITLLLSFMIRIELQKKHLTAL